MGKTNNLILDSHRAFIEKQKMFFVSTAPLAESGHVNLSPKGTDTFRILSPGRVAYLDYVGSGNETSAHLVENGRITIMFCAFEGAPNILRVYGKGETVLPGSAEWAELYAHFNPHPGTRQIIVVNIGRVSTSCGYGIPYYDYKGERDQFDKWVERKGANGLEEYKKEHNMVSLDGLPTAISKSMEP